MDMKEKMLNRKVIFEGKVIKVYHDEVLCPNGNLSKREIINHNGGSSIIGITNENKILLIKQYRYAYDEVIYEIPAGKIELGEDPLVCAKRELEEETGYFAENIEYMQTIYPTCGYSNEKIYIYYAYNLTKTKQHFDDDEIIEVYEFSFDEALELIKSGEIKDAKTIIAIYAYLNKV